MANTYIKPTTMVCKIKIDSQLLSGSPGEIGQGYADEPAGAKTNTFEFFTFEEEEVTSEKEDDDWEEWEDEEDP